MDASVILAALFAGLVAVLITRAIETWGGIIGGFLGSVPSTIIPAALGISANSASPELFAAAMDITPVGMLLNAFFLFAWRFIPPRLKIKNQKFKLLCMIISTLGLWCLLAASSVLGVAAIKETGFDGFWLGFGATVLMVIIGIAACIKNPPAPKGKHKVSLSTLIARGLLAATAIGGCVLISSGDSTESSLLAGMVSVFPAIFLTTMVSLWWSQGETVPTGAAGPMMLGSTSVALFAMIIPRALPYLGPWLACLLAWVIAVGLVTIPSSLWLTKRTARINPEKI